MRVPVVVLGAIVITGLSSAFIGNVADDPRISRQLSDQVEVRLASGSNFVAADEVEAAAAEAGLDRPTTTALVSDYTDAQLASLKLAFLCAAFLVLAALLATGNLPTRRFSELQAAEDP